MTAIVLQGEAQQLPLPDASVDLIATSPPYFALRSYQDDGEHYPGQIGSEATPVEFLEALWTCTREWMRVLKPAGSLFVNLGDKYGRGTRNTATPQSNVRTGSVPAAVPITGLDKSLLGIPWRYAIGCIDQLGLILRAELIWSKPNGLPESVTDRVRRSHEQWFHFTQQPRYFSAVDEIREQYAPGTAERYRSGYKANGRSAAGQQTTPSIPVGVDDLTVNSLGKLPGSVWEIPTEPLVVPAEIMVDHFAAFPTAWPRRLILGWSPAGICTGCGEGRQPVTPAAEFVAGDPAKRSLGIPAAERERAITGYACACPDTSAPSRPAVVLDPFGGTGTTAAVASALGRVGISVDLSHDYSRLAVWRTRDPELRAKIRDERRPIRQAEGQVSLW